MRRKMLFLLTIVVIITVGCISVAGGCSCNDGHGSYDIPEHEFEDDDYATSTVLPSQEDLGVPVYDENLDPSSVESSETTSNGEVTDAGVDYDTKDDYGTVFSWYKDKLGEPTETQVLSEGHNQAWWTMEKNGKYIQVIITCTDEGTAISIITEKM
jgi:hypothetical protein